MIDYDMMKARAWGAGIVKDGINGRPQKVLLSNFNGRCYIVSYCGYYQAPDWLADYVEDIHSLHIPAIDVQLG